MPGNEIIAAAKKIKLMIAEGKLDGSDDDVLKLVPVYRRHRIVTPEKIALVNEELIKMGDRESRESGMLGQLEFRTRTARIKRSNQR